MKNPRQKINRLNRKTIVHIITGSIASYKAGDLIHQLRQDGFRVICVLTESAKHFVTPLTLRAISGEKVYEDFFSPDLPYDVIHTSLAEEAALILVAPASANFIARVAAGLADDLASCVILAARKPIVLVPAMNDIMYEHPITQQNIAALKKIGHHFINPIVGRLVCGKEAIGHVSDPSTISSRLKKII